MSLTKTNVYKIFFAVGDDFLGRRTGEHHIYVVADSFEEAKEIALQEKDRRNSFHTLVKMELFIEGVIVKENKNATEK